jgi:hypothetical protein
MISGAYLMFLKAIDSLPAGQIARGSANSLGRVTALAVTAALELDHS